jgi:hypothetical protein
MPTISRLYDNYADAAATVNALEEANVGKNDISIVANADARGRSTDPDSRAAEPETKTGAGTGAGIGAALGGGIGLLAGIGTLAIPGIGPLVAAGWLATTLAGAAVGAGAGGIVGALTGAGVSREEAHVYEEGIRRGGSLVTVRADEDERQRVEAIMDVRHPRHWQDHAEEYRATGWDYPQAAEDTSLRR